MKLTRFIIAALLLASCAGKEMEEFEEPAYAGPEYVNPTYDGSTIKAELAINVPVGNMAKPSTRMSAEIVQDKSVEAEQRFRGIQDLVLIPYKADVLVDNKATDGSHFAAAPMSLSAFSTSNIENWYIDNTGQQLLGSSQVYSDVTIPIDTKHFVLYGRAMDNAVGDDRDFKNGRLIGGDGTQGFQGYLLNQNTNLSQTTFALKKVKASDYITDGNPTGELANAESYLLTVLNNLLKVSIPAHDATAESPMAWDAATWEDMQSAHVTGGTDENLLNVAGLYNALVGDGKTALQAATAGSASAVRLRLDALYRSALSYTRHQNNDGTISVYKRTDSSAGALPPIFSSTMAYAIMDAIVGTVTPAGMAGIQMFQFSSDGMTENFGWAPQTASMPWLTNFPGYFHLPDGTYQLKYNTEGAKQGQFTYVNFTIGDAGSLTSGLMNLDPRQICYPAELIYMANSGLRERQGVDDTWRWPTTLEAWNNNDGTGKEYWPNTGDGNTGWYEDRAVNSATTAIAMKDQAQYAVASLKTRVKCGASALADNRREYDNAAGDQMVPVPAGGIRITGVLIGNQPDAVDWQLMPKKQGGSFVDGDFSRIVYDRDVPADFYAPYSTSIETCVPNFTLLLDNNNESQSTLANAVKVNVALEFENNTGVGFYGVHGGFIPVGGKFYIIGKMDISAITDANRHETTHVFQQDFMTEANFTVTALKYAYNVIPDLRSAKLEFGLSVDIDWKQGAVFDIEVGE